MFEAGLKTKENEQAGAELGQAQLKLALVCTLIKVVATNMINKKYIARCLVSFC